MASSNDTQSVLIAGAGPVGLFTALLLARDGIRVELFERYHELRAGPRAAGHYGPDLEVMKKAGVFEQLKAEANMQDGIGWRARPVPDDKSGKTFGKMLAYIPDEQLIIPQTKLTRIVAKEALDTGLVNINFEREVIGVEDGKDFIKVTTKNPATGELQVFQGTYLIGCDGARSAVRRLAGIRFPGHTWPETLVATDVLITNHEVAPVQPHFVVHPTNFGVIIPLQPVTQGEKSLWRYAFAVSPEEGTTDEELLHPALIKKYYELMMVGPRPLEYEVKQKATYKTHQRLASTMRRGRVILAGDAAHLCNPIGGMGLTTGILDSETLADALTMVLKEGYPDVVLQIYSDLRRQAFGLFVDPMSTMNKARIQNEPEEIESEDFLVRLIKTNPKSLEHISALYKERWRSEIRPRIAQMGIKPRP